MSLFKKLLSSPAAMLKLSIGVAYLILGAVIWVYRYQFNLIDPKYAPFLAVLLIAYGVFRLYRAVNDVRND